MTLINTRYVPQGQRPPRNPFSPASVVMFWVLGSDDDARELAETASRNSGSEEASARVVWVQSPADVNNLFPVGDPRDLRGFTTTYGGLVSRVFGRSEPVPDDLQVSAAFTAAMTGKTAVHS
jgi:hypothetical protein